MFLECTSGGNPYPSFKFFKIIDDVEVEVTSEMDSRYTLSSGRLTIEDPEIKDTGYYQCKATNDHGTVLSRFAQIQFGCKYKYFRCISFFRGKINYIYQDSVSFFLKQWY